MIAEPNDSSSDARYDEEYFRDVYNVDGPRWTEMNFWSIRFYARVCERLLVRKERGKVLEIGCGLGFLLARLEKRHETFGVDLSSFAIERAQRFAPRTTFGVGDLTGELPHEVERGGFDLVAARHVLEHIADPAPAIARLFRLTAPGGRLLLVVPSMASPGLRLKGDDWFGFRDETHVSLHQPETWRRMVSGAGYTIESVASDGMWDVPYAKRMPRVLQYLRYSLPAIVSVVLGRMLIPVERGESLILVARRPIAESRNDSSRGTE